MDIHKFAESQLSRNSKTVKLPYETETESKMWNCPEENEAAPKKMSEEREIG